MDQSTDPRNTPPLTGEPVVLDAQSTLAEALRAFGVTTPGCDLDPLERAFAVAALEQDLLGGCGICDSDAIDLCGACGHCRCYRHDECVRPAEGGAS